LKTNIIIPMTFTITVPNEYGYVILTCVVGQFVASTMMGGIVMNARTKFQVPYPNLYATPGFHKQADAFNRVQRGHQNMLETLGTFSLMSLVGGLKYPLAVSGCSAVYFLGAYLFQLGYSDTALDVNLARYKKGGILKWVGFMGAFGCSVATAGSMIGWW
jgi:glutathione S-transferase